MPALVAVNVIVFGLWQLAWAGGYLGGLHANDGLRFMARHFMVSAAGLEHGDVWTLLTSAFSHNAFPHLFFNLLALTVFGRDVERVVGPRRFLFLYVGGGVVASLGHVLYGLATSSAVPALGASGAVMAVAVVAAFLFPTRVLLLFFVVPLPQFVAVALFVMLDVLGAVSPSRDMIAHAAHLGGALFGFLDWQVHLKPWLVARIEELQRRRHAQVWEHPPV